MGFTRGRFFGVLIGLMVCAPLFGEAAETAPAMVYRAAEQWRAIEGMFLAGGDTDGAAFFHMVEEFRAALEAFLASPLYKVYRYHPAFSRGPSPVQEILELTGAFTRALREGQREAALTAALAIQGGLNRWLSLDAALADSIHRTYSQQFSLFLAVIALLILAIYLMGKALEGSRRRERERGGFFRALTLAQEGERSRLARELHDTVIPDIRALSYIPFKNPGAAVGDEVNARCDAVIGRLRDICHVLIPPDFNSVLLTESLTGLCEAFQKRSGIECRLVAADDLRLVPLGAEAQLHCYRIIQEALENIERHSHASEASVVLRNEGSALLIMITDDGRGFDTADYEGAGNTGGHLGIRGMYERAALLGGVLSFESGSGEGVMVRLELPL